MQIRKLVVIICLIMGVTGCGRSTHDMTDVETQSMESTESTMTDTQEVALDSTAYQTKLILKACENLNAFQLLAFHIENVDENGNVTYQEQTLFGMDSMNKDTSLVLGMSFVGEVPFYGVSYLDENGVEKKYCFQIDEWWRTGIDGVG